MNPAKFNARPSPGPGDYKSKAISSGVPASRGVTISRTGEHLDRNLQLAGAETPGPGSYEADRPHSEPPQSKHSPGKRRVLVDQEIAGLSERARLRYGRNYLAKTEAGDKIESTSIDVECEAKPQAVGQSESHVFKCGTSHMPRKWRDPSPGPGQYDNANIVDTTCGTAASSFSSKTRRFRDRVPMAPGPAYYRPKIAEGQSDFHLNPQTLWT